jgi:hypothetical protein
MVIWRLPLLALNSGETKRLSAAEVQFMLNCQWGFRLPWGISLDQAWDPKYLSRRFIVYWEKGKGTIGKFPHRFCLTESRCINQEIVLDRGPCGVLEYYTARREDAHTFFWAKSPKIGRCKFVLPIDTHDWSKWPEVPVG